MKLPILASVLFLLAAPAGAWADRVTDSKIEDAAKATYNYHAVLQDSIKVRASDGVVTLTGSVSDPDLKALAEDTVANLPGVVSVDNQIKVVPPAPEHSDGWIATKIRTKLLLKGNVSAMNTKVDVKDGSVTLTGQTENMAQKELTGAYASETEGVKNVNNLLTLTPEPADPRTMGDRVDDASITAQVKYALLTHKSTGALRTSVTTRNGVVSVEGEAGSAAERDLVTKLAEGVRGVKSVTNSMSVKG